jgi:periplasmic protein TonB
VSALSLHLPEQRGIARWGISAVAIVAAHAAIIAAIVLWYARTPPQPNVIDAIAITFAPPTSIASPAPNQDLPIGTPQERQEEVLEPPKVEPQPEQQVEKVEPPPPATAEVDLPKPAEPKREKRPLEQKPAQEQRIAARSEAERRSSVAASQIYNRLVSGHLRRYIRTSVAEKYGSGQAAVKFVLNRQGQVLSVKLTMSSGNAALDQEALAIVNRANPFPPFPAEKTVAQDSFDWPVVFERPK